MTAPSTGDVAPADEAGPIARAASLSLYFVGSAAGIVFLQSTLPIATIPVVAGALTAAYAARALVRERAPWKRALGGLGWAVTALVHALWAYLAIAWGSVLAWTLPWWGWGAIAASSVAVAWTAIRRPRGVRVPIAVPLGAWIALCLLGWRLEEQRARCDDYLALRRDARVAVLEPSSRELEGCEPGTTVPIGRFPRVVWESEDGARMIVTTSAGPGSPMPTSARFTGSVCELRRGHEPRCEGDGKGQAIVEAPARDRIFVATWGRLGEGIGGRVLAIPLHGPFEIAAEASTRSRVGELFYDPSSDRLYGFTDEGGEIVPLVASTMIVEHAVPAPLPPPGAIRYDQARGEGLVCAAGGPVATLSGQPFMSVAVRGAPLALRPVGTGSLALATLTWGCDFDPVGRRAWVAIPNLGVLATIDYDTGALVRTDFVGFGMRSVTHDAARRRLYLTSFLGGHVVAVDLETGEEIERWSVGRFPRTVTIGRDGASLLVGTNLGLISIALDPAP